MKLNPREPNAQGIVYDQAIRLGVPSAILDRLREALNSEDEELSYAARYRLGLTTDSRAVRAVNGSSDACAARGCQYNVVRSPDGAAEKDTHRCSGCGHRWEGPLRGAELCGDCWRTGQSAIFGAAEGRSRAVQPLSELLMSLGAFCRHKPGCSQLAGPVRCDCGLGAAQEALIDAWHGSGGAVTFVSGETR